MAEFLDEIVYLWNRVDDSLDAGFNISDDVDYIFKRLELHKDYINRISDPVSRNLNFDDYKEALIISISKRKMLNYRLDYRSRYLDLYSNFAKDNRSYLNSISIESFRTMILLNGAWLLGNLTVLSGQFERSASEAYLAAKIGSVFALLSLGSLAIGQIILFQYGDRVSSVVATTVGIGKPWSRVKAIPRYLRINYSKKRALANAFIYGSIGIFALGAAICAIILLFSLPA